MIKANQRFAIVNLRAVDLFRQPEGYRQKTPTGTWWRDKLASLCWRLLHRLRAVEQYGFTETTYVYTPSQQADITHRLMEGIDGVFKRGDDIADYCLILGAEDFSLLISSEAIQKMLTVATQEIYYQDRSGYRLEYHGLPVHVVPNVSGSAVIPKVIIEKSKPYAKLANANMV